MPNQPILPTHLVSFFQLLFVLVLVVGCLVCNRRLKATQSREAKLVGLAIAMFVARIVVACVLQFGIILVCGDLWERSQSSRFYARVNWWVGLTASLIDSTFYAAAWGWILYAVFSSPNPSASNPPANQAEGA